MDHFQELLIESRLCEMEKSLHNAHLQLLVSNCSSDRLKIDFEITRPLVEPLAKKKLETITFVVI